MMQKPLSPKSQEARWKKFWQEKVGAMSTPFFARADTTLKPIHIDIDHVGHHISVVPEMGTRVYCFATQQFRDRFVVKYRPHNAKPCSDRLMIAE